MIAASPPPAITAAELESLLRLGNEEPESYLESLSTVQSIDGLSTEVRFHRIAHEATGGTPDLKKLTNKLIGALVDFACTRSEIASAKAMLESSGSTEGFVGLYEKARSLFTSSGKSGEPGELLLYMLTERVLGYPQILCKFPHKTNAAMHTHGADGIHGSTDPETGHLRLHWGEAKFYDDWSAALTDCMTSMVELILDPAGATKDRSRDITLLRDFIDLDNPSLEAGIIDYLTPDKRVSNKIKYCGVCVIGFNQLHYDKLFGLDDKKLKSLVQRKIRSLKKSILKSGLTAAKLDIFCIPCKSVSDFRKSFNDRLGL